MKDLVVHADDATASDTIDLESHDTASYSYQLNLRYCRTNYQVSHISDNDIILKSYVTAGVQETLISLTSHSTTKTLTHTATSAIALDTWVHVVFTLDGNVMKLYLNGVLKQTKVDGHSPMQSPHYVGSF